MASDRRSYVRVADSVLREPWGDRTLATLVRLMAFLNTRWARDRLTAEEAGDAFLRPQEMILVAGVTHVTRARKLLLALPEKSRIGTLEVTPEIQGRVRGVRVRWSKFPEYQGYRDVGRPRVGGEAGAKQGVPLPPPLPPPNPPPREREGSSSLAFDELVRILDREPGSVETKQAWLRSELPIIRLKAEVEHPDDPTRQGKAMRTRVLTHYRQHLGTGRSGLPTESGTSHVLSPEILKLHKKIKGEPGD